MGTCTRGPGKVETVARNIGFIVEDQVKRWQIEHREKGKGEHGEYVPPPVIALSNQVASAGLPVAQKVGELLGIPVYDREIVEHIATTEKVHVEVVDSLDEKSQSRVDDYVLNLFRERNFDQSDYVRALTHTITSLWAHGSCVMIGRGASHIVWRKRLLAVRMVAPYAQRVHRAQDLLKLDKAAAQKYIQRTDAERAAFIRRYFAKDIDDPVNYDMVLNSAGLDIDRMARLVVAAYREKFGE